MADIYVFDAHAEDFTTHGLVGALEPTSCYFEEETNGMSEISLEHPIDVLGKYRALAINNLLVVDVPVRTTPEMPDDDSEGFVTNVWRSKIQVGSAASRTLYKSRTGNVKLKVLKAGRYVTIVKKYAEGRWKIKSDAGSGWIDQDALGEEIALTIENKSQGIETVEPAWVVKPQIFRIYEVRKDISSITAMARHITYDLLYQTTNFKASGTKTCKEALAGIFDNLYGYGENDIIIKPLEFNAYTNLANEYAGIDWRRINPINALLDPEIGLTTLFKATLVRDNWDMYFLKDPGLYRGVSVEYSRNMTGIEYIESTDEIATRIIPVGEKENGDPLVYEPVYSGGIVGSPYVNYIDSPKKVMVDGIETPIVYAYPIPYTMVLECEDCKVGSGGITTEVQAYARMREQVAALYADDIDLPKIEMSVDFVTLGDTEEYKQFRDMERLFLSDLVHVKHPKHGIDVTAKVCYIKWDVLLGRMERIDVGSSIKTLAQVPGYTSTGGGFIVAGGTLDGALILKKDPTEPMEAVTKQYVDSEIRKVSGGSGSAVSYYTDEITTGGLWLDNKPLYQKTIIIPAIEAGATTTNIADLATDGIETIAKFEGVLLRDHLVYPLGFETVSSTVYKADFYLNITNDSLTVRTNSNTAISGGHVTIWYTKTADVPVDPDDGYAFLIDSEGNSFITADGEIFKTEV